MLGTPEETGENQQEVRPHCCSGRGSQAGMTSSAWGTQPGTKEHSLPSQPQS